ncbi:MAG TPA: carboxypeptidase-like regulatory domain-containing protein [Blastocatellia bacterium]|nr:carboxypeptidase-like regulatory domain-containing protein [Blastocatellia bacterium]
MQPCSFAKPYLLLILISLIPVWVSAQPRPAGLERDVRPRNCSLSGRVTINGQPAANLSISIMEAPTDWDSAQPIRQMADGSISRMTHKTRTDADGRYQFTNLPPGRYAVMSSAKAFVAIQAGSPSNELKTLTLDAGESEENVNFTLVRGGVITGQITDAEGRPVIAHSARLFQVTFSQDGRRQIQPYRGDYGDGQTDDRGVYRIYGLPAGMYVVGAGGEDSFFSIEKYPPVFYPETSDRNQAQILELTAGKEITDINLRLGASRKRYEAVGRVIEADTGKPVPNVHVGGNKIRRNQTNNEQETDGTETEGGSNSGYTQADQLGNFRLTGLARGKYTASIFGGWMESSEYYAEPSTFEIIDGDISGVEIKAVRGGVISGLCVIEGTADPTVKSKLTQIQITAYTKTAEGASPDQPSSHHNTQPKPDGSFLITGVAPGKVQLHADSPTALYLTRIERSGVEIKSLLEVSKGEKITDVRFVFSAGTGIIRGQVQVVGGKWPGGQANGIEARLIGNSAGRITGAEIDDKGRFELTNLPNGEYELRLNQFARNAAGDYEMRTLAKQRVTVSSGAEARVILIYDPTRKPEEDK